jgi:hypothetical protein
MEMAASGLCFMASTNMVGRNLVTQIRTFGPTNLSITILDRTCKYCNPNNLCRTTLFKEVLCSIYTKFIVTVCNKIEVRLILHSTVHLLIIYFVRCSKHKDNLNAVYAYICLFSAHVCHCPCAFCAVPPTFIDRRLKCPDLKLQ